MKAKNWLFIFAIIIVVWVCTMFSGESLAEESHSPESELEEAKTLKQQVITLYNQGRYADAIPVAKKVLMITEKYLGPEHPEVAQSLNNLASLYAELGSYAIAESLYQQALEIDEQTLGPEHPVVATDLNNLAVLYDNMGAYVKAEPLYQRALAIQEKTLGPEHPEVATTLNNLAVLYKSQGEYAKTEPLYQRALAIHRKLGDRYGEGNILTSIGVVYVDLGQYQRALAYYEQALAIARELGDIQGEVRILSNLGKVEIIRYPTIETPDQVPVGQKFSVQISLTEEKITPEVEISQGTVTKDGQLSMQLPAQPEQDAWDIDVALFAEGFTFRGANTTTISLPRKGDSTPAIFFLTPKPINAPTQVRKLYATLWHKGKFLAKIMRDITVTSVTSPLPAKSALKQPKAATLPLLQLPSFTPDLTVYILHAFNPDSPDTSLIMINSPALQLTVDKVMMDAEVSVWLKTNYDRLSKTTARSVERFTESASVKPQKDKNIARLKGFGKEVYQKFAPDAFKNVFWTLKDTLGAEFDSIQIFTNDPILPWELMRPTRADGSDEQDFLGMNFRIARWHVSQSATQLLESPPDILNLKDLVVIAPQYQGRQILPHVADELEALQKFSGFRRMPGRFEMLQQLFASAAFKEGILHFAGHGYVRTDQAGLIEYTIQLEDGELDVLTWQGLVSGKREAHPFVFFNACDIGRAHQFANFVEGWAPAILEGGASGYIGGLWPLGDQGAAEFAIHFYQHLLHELERGPVVVADILRHTRKQFYENGDPTFMAYVYYGYPDFHLNPSQ